MRHEIKKMNHKKHFFAGHYGSTGNSYYGGSNGYDNQRGQYGPPQVVDYPRYGYGSGYGNGYGGGYDNINGLDWGTNTGYGDGVYGIGEHDGINIGGKVNLIFFNAHSTNFCNKNRCFVAYIEISLDTIGRSRIIRNRCNFGG